MNVQVVSVDGSEPITIGEAKLQCYIPITESDADTEIMLEGLITAARQYAENRTWRTLIDKTLELRMDEFPYGITETDSGTIKKNIIHVPNPPLKTVTSIKYMSGGSELTLDESTYNVDANSTPGRIEPIEHWPNTDDVIDAVRIRYTAGGTVDEQLKIAMRMMIKFLFDNRDSHVLLERSGEYQEAPIGTNMILDQYSTQRFV